MTCQALREAHTSLRSADLLGPKYQGLTPSLISLPELSDEYSFND
jgi:hypothetical protein